MLKKFVSSCLLILMLCGCSEGNVNASASVSEVHSVSKTREDSSSQAGKILKMLDMEDELTQAKERVVLGMFFNGDKEAFTDATVYLSEEAGNVDTIGVFITEDMDSCLQYIQTYLETQKAETQNYYPRQVFKISNAVVEYNSSELILIVCENIEKAKNAANELLEK